MSSKLQHSIGTYIKCKRTFNEDYSDIWDNEQLFKVLFDSARMDNAIDYYLPNKVSKYSISLAWDDGEAINSIPEESNGFLSEEFDEIYDLLIDRYGSDNVTVEYGILSYYM